MLAVESLRGSNGDDRDGTMGSFSDFADEALFDDINFGDLFMGIDDGDMLPDLELDPTEIFAEFSVGEEEGSSTPTAAVATEGMVGVDGVTKLDVVVLEGERREEKDMRHGEEGVSATTKEEPTVMLSEVRLASLDGDKGRKSSAAGAAKCSQRKRKAKVDWTPELHRRFVQAVDKLGMDKAVPSRILELMDIDCLTRHNISSHLQKYRSHRKHLLVREAEAASWSQRRQMYAKRDINPWLAQAIGFLPPPPPPPPPPVLQPFRPLHVWGHPTAEAPPVHMSSQQLVPPLWAAQPPLPPVPPDPSFWHHHYQWGSGEGGVPPAAMAKAASCFPHPLPTVRFPAPPVPGIVPHLMYRPVKLPPMTMHSSSQPQLDAHPSKESIDAAIGGVLGKLWLPLPLGLKPPSLDSVLVELQKQGLSEVP